MRDNTISRRRFIAMLGIVPIAGCAVKLAEKKESE